MSAQDKSLSQDSHAKELGWYSNGDRGTLGSTVDRRLATAGISLYVIGADRPHRMWLALATGCWNFVFQFRRPTSCVLFQTWRAISHWVNCRALPREVGRGLLMAIFLMPIMITKLRAKLDLMLTCSDASENGSGVAAAAGLTA